MAAGCGANDKQMVKGGTRARGATAFGIFATVMFLALVGRLVHLQVMEHEDFTRKAARQIYGVVHDRDRRGVITDARGTTLASSVAVNSCALDPKVLLEAEGAKPEQVVAKLTEILGLTPAETKRVNQGVERRKTRTLEDGTVGEEPYRFVWVKRILSGEEHQRLAAAMDAAEREAAEAWRFRRR